MDDYDPMAWKLHATTDAQVWAEEFCRLFKVTNREPHEPSDSMGLMIGWFANAIEIGRDAGRRQEGWDPGA